MTTQLPERLRALAEGAPAALDGAELWRAGRRRQRTRRATALVVASVLVLGTALAGYGNWRSQRPDPAAPPATRSGPMSIPERFYEPSPWLPTTKAPGRLVAVIPEVSQHHVVGGPTTGVVGVAAGSQRYTFLDLPDQDTASFASTVALSPDGLHLAYVYDGSVPEPSWEKKESDAVGVAVLDLTTGAIERHDISGDLGFNNVDLGWASSTVLLAAATWPPATFHEYHTRGYHTANIRYTVGSSSGEPMKGFFPSPPISLHSDSEYATPGGGHQVTVRVADSGRLVSTFTAAPWNGSFDAALDEDGHRFATVRGNGFRRVVWGRVVDGHATLRDVPGAVNEPGHLTKTPQTLNISVLVWADRQHVVVGRARYPGGHYALAAVDVRDGSVRILVRQAGHVLVASDAWEHPHVVPAVAPPDPWDRRALLLSLLVGALVLVGAGWLTAKELSRVQR